MSRRIKFLDSHIHLNSEKLCEWEQKTKDKEELFVWNNVSTNLKDFEIALKQSEKYENVFVTAGIHPLEVENFDLEKTFEMLELKIQENSKIIAIGETGLDFYRAEKATHFEIQKTWFLKHLELAKKYDLPIVIHARSSHEEILEILKQEVHKGVIHCFDGSYELAQRYLDLPGNWMLSISPIVFRQGNQTRKIIGQINIEKLMVETDAPYLTKECLNPIKEAIKEIAIQKNMYFEECCQIIWKNSIKFFNLEALYKN